MSGPGKNLRSQKSKLKLCIKTLLSRLMSKVFSLTHFIQFTPHYIRLTLGIMNVVSLAYRCLATLSAIYFCSIVIKSKQAKDKIKK